MIIPNPCAVVELYIFVVDNGAKTQICLKIFGKLRITYSIYKNGGSQKLTARVAVSCQVQKNTSERQPLHFTHFSCTTQKISFIEGSHDLHPRRSSLD